MFLQFEEIKFSTQICSLFKRMRVVLVKRFTVKWLKVKDDISNTVLKDILIVDVQKNIARLGLCYFFDLQWISFEGDST